MNSALGHADPTIANRTEREWQELEAAELTRWIGLLADIPINRLQCLNQDVWWSSRKGWLKIEEMDQGHRQNTAAFILRNAESWWFKWYLYYGASGGPYATDSDHDFENLTSTVWMKQTPLYLALTEGNS